LYCDTDSIFFSFRENKLGSRFGDIFLDPAKEDLIIEKACFAASKAYSVVFKKKNITKIKGIPQKRSIDMSFEEFEKLFLQGESRNMPVDLFRKKNLNLKIEEISKTINLGGYDKRLFSRDKKNTKPLTIYPI
jgi:uncharacterized protein YhbP (UPF0306 family)